MCRNSQPESTQWLEKDGNDWCKQTRPKQSRIPPWWRYEHVSCIYVFPNIPNIWFVTSMECTCVTFLQTFLNWNKMIQQIPITLWKFMNPLQKVSNTSRIVSWSGTKRQCSLLSTGTWDLCGKICTNKEAAQVQCSPHLNTWRPAPSNPAGRFVLLFYDPKRRWLQSSTW